MKAFIGIILIIISCSIITRCTVKEITFDKHCTGYLKRAGDANTIPMASKELGKAIQYLEDHNLTKGYTSVFYTTPDEDIEFFYNNLKASKAELDSISPNATPLERSNMLIKLRETLLDQGQSLTVTCPDGLSRYPDNSNWLIYNLIAAALLIFGGVCVLIEISDF